MPSPVKVSEIAELVPGATDTICSAMVKVLIKLPVRALQVYKYLVDSQGNINSSFAGDICTALAACPP